MRQPAPAAQLGGLTVVFGACALSASLELAARAALFRLAASTLTDAAAVEMPYDVRDLDPDVQERLTNAPLTPFWLDGHRLHSLNKAYRMLDGPSAFQYHLPGNKVDTSNFDSDEEIYWARPDNQKVEADRGKRDQLRDGPLPAGPPDPTERGQASKSRSQI